MSGLALRDVTKSYGDVKVIHGVNLDIKDNEFVVFVGPSGCGKSTLLRIIAGLEDISGGTIHIGAKDVTDLEPVDRGIAMVFQTYALYPHMTVEENMSFGLRVTGVPEAEIRTRVAEAAKSLQLDPYLARKPSQLSGGQRQRVAIGRAIVRKPEVFLFDEPLSNLDAELRVHMRIEIARLHQRLGSTMVYVTHDQVEAMTLADKIVVLQKGRIEQVGSPLDLFDNPDNQFVAGFIGSPKMNFLAGTVENAAGGRVRVKVNGTDTTFDYPLSGQLPSIGAVVAIGSRPEHLTANGTGPASITGAVDVVEQMGEVGYIHARTPDGTHIVAQAQGRQDYAAGAPVVFTFDPARAFLFDQSGMRLR